MDFISEKGPDHELTSNTLLSVFCSQKLDSNCAHPSHESKLLIVYIQKEEQTIKNEAM